MNMKLEDLGYTEEIDNYFKRSNIPGAVACRVTQEHRERYVISDGPNEYEAEITGNLRFSAQSRAGFPAVGDWVVATVYDQSQAIIHQVMPRSSVLERQYVSKTGEKQIISANIDFAFIMQSIDNNFNLNRIERYLTVCYSSEIVPIIVISKTDLADNNQVEKVLKAVGSRENNITTLLLSNTSKNGLDKIREVIMKGKTYCVVGSSGVGKSTLINNLLEKDILKTGSISVSTNKGRHVTSHRELFVLENGGIIIDTPGMRELGVTESETGLKTTFEDISSLSLKCKFPDCTHTNEPGCAVNEAIENGSLEQGALENYRRIRRDQERFQTSVAEKHRKEQVLGKYYKSVVKEIKKNKY